MKYFYLQVNCVLVGFDPHHSIKKMTKAATYARNPKNLFLATNEDPFLPLKGNLVIPGLTFILLPVSSLIPLPNRNQGIEGF